MNAPGFFVRLQVGHFPAGLADLGARRRRVAETLGEFLPDEAMLRVGLSTAKTSVAGVSVQSTIAAPIGSMSLGAQPDQPCLREASYRIRRDRRSVRSIAALHHKSVMPL